MKQWEKLTAWLVVFALVAGLVGGSAFVQVSAAEENSDFAYVVNEDGTATITEVKTNAADVIVPAVIDGHTVTAIGSHTSEWSTTPAGAFESKWQAVNVYLPDTITSFADRAFASCAVEHIYRYDPAQISAEDIVSSGSADALCGNPAFFQLIDNVIAECIIPDLCNHTCLAAEFSDCSCYICRRTAANSIECCHFF